MNQRIWLLFVIICFIGVVSACGAKDNAQEPDPDAEPPPIVDQHSEADEQNIEEDTTILPYKQPLTGIRVEQELKTRPIMVMVENQKQSRPQSGLFQADVVYEILAEGEITRFVAVYQSHEPDIIGPVRSIRPYFVEIGDGLDALIVHAGWSQAAINMIKQRNLPHFDQVYGDHAYYWRSSERSAPHNLYTSIAKIREGAANKKFSEDWDDPQMLFSEEDHQLAIVGEPAAEVTIPYIQGYQVTYKYNDKLKIYDRYMAGELHRDKETNTPLTAKNIIVALTNHKVLDSAGRREVNVNGPGKGFLIQEGKIREITWQSQDGMIRPMADGQVLPLLPGKTWIHYTPIDAKIAAK